MTQTQLTKIETKLNNALKSHFFTTSDYDYEHGEIEAWNIVFEIVYNQLGLNTKSDRKNENILKIDEFVGITRPHIHIERNTFDKITASRSELFFRNCRNLTIARIYENELVKEDDEFYFFTVNTVL